MKKVLSVAALSCVAALAPNSLAQTQSRIAWQTTFNCNEWRQTAGKADSVADVNCDGLRGFGSWTTLNGSVEQITAAANYPGGGGGRGKRHWRGDGRNNHSGSLNLTFANVGLPTWVPEFWIRWYMRYPSGFKWAGGIPAHTKELHCFQPGTFSRETETGMIGGDQWSVEVYYNSHRNNASGFGWLSKFSDGNWHSVEVHLKASTTGTGITQVWIDGVQAIDVRNETFVSAQGWSDCALGSNGFAPLNGVDMPVDYDDFALSTQGYIGPISGSQPTTAPQAPTNLRIASWYRQLWHSTALVSRTGSVSPAL